MYGLSLVLSVLIAVVASPLDDLRYSVALVLVWLMGVLTFTWGYLLGGGLDEDEEEWDR